MQKKFFLTIMVLLFVIIAAPVNSVADSVECNELLFTAELQNDGSAKITESWAFDFPNSDYSKFYRGINFEGDITITDISVEDEYGNPYTKLEGFDSNRPEGCFAYETVGDEVLIEIYHRTNNRSRIFVINYTVNNIVTVYNDTAEFYYKVIGEDLNLGDIDIVQAAVTFPSDATGDNVRYWAHSYVRGVIERENDKTITYYSENVPTDQFTELRVLLPTELFPLAANLVNEDKFDEIIEEEQKLAEETSYPGSEEDYFIAGILDINPKTVRTIKGFFGIAIPIIFFLLTKKLSRKNAGRSLSGIVKRYYKPNLKPQYYRELPSDITPAEAAELLKIIGKLSPTKTTQYSATLLDLNLKGYINLATDKKDVIISFNDSSDYTSLKKHEKILYDILLEARKSSTSISMKDFASYIKKYASKMQAKFKKFDNEVMNLLEDREFFVFENHSKINKAFFENKTHKQILIINLAFLIIGTVLIFTGLFVGKILVSLTGLLPYIVVVVLYNSRKDKKYLSQKAEDEGALWSAFVEFLKDFTLFKERELPELKVWERYLVYAVAAGVSKKVIKNLPVAYSDVDYTQLNQNTFLYLMFINSMGNKNAFDSINKQLLGSLNVFENATQAAISFNSTTKSGGAGFGGVSSFGGGGGFGGGSAGHS